MSRNIIVVLSLDDLNNFEVKKVLEDGVEYLRAVRIEEGGEFNRGVDVAYDDEKSFEENLFDLYDFLDEFIDTDLGEKLLGDSGELGSKFQH